MTQDDFSDFRQDGESFHYYSNNLSLEAIAKLKKGSEFWQLSAPIPTVSHDWTLRLFVVGSAKNLLHGRMERAYLLKRTVKLEGNPFERSER